MSGLLTLSSGLSLLSRFTWLLGPILGFLFRHCGFLCTAIAATSSPINLTSWTHFRGESLSSPGFYSHSVRSRRVTPSHAGSRMAEEMGRGITRLCLLGTMPAALLNTGSTQHWQQQLRQQAALGAAALAAAAMAATDSTGSKVTGSRQTWVACEQWQQAAKSLAVDRPGLPAGSGGKQHW